jgi:hypothetical protein
MQLGDISKAFTAMHRMYQAALPDLKETDAKESNIFYTWALDHAIVGVNNFIEELRNEAKNGTAPQTHPDTEVIDLRSPTHSDACDVALLRQLLNAPSKPIKLRRTSSLKTKEYHFLT